MPDSVTIMTTSLAQAALTRVEAANGVTYAYRRFGRVGHDVPVVFLQHFRGSIDDWDPALVDPIAAARDVILVDNTGIGATTGVTPTTIEQMADDAGAFIDALDLHRVDLFGYSIGGFVAQQLALNRPDLVRRLILAGTGPKGAPGMGAWRPDVVDGVVVDETTPDGVLHVFYTPTDSSRAAGRASFGRIYQPRDDRGDQPSIESKNAQYEAVKGWGVPDWGAVERLTHIVHPTLILQGDSDIMIPTSASYLMAGLIPDASITIYPDASHGAIFQYAQDASRRALSFLAA
jgi:pimeloyl-ACP methyl ester carboxylesterase